MIRRVRQLLSLPAADGWLFLQAWIGLLIVDVGLRCGGRSGLERWAAAPAGGEIAPAALASALVRGRRLAELVGLAARFHLHPVRCMTRSLTLQFLLTRRGLDAELRIGVRKDADRLRAHAWLELAGEPLGEPADVDQLFPPLVSLSSRETLSTRKRLPR